MDTHQKIEQELQQKKIDTTLQKIKNKIIVMSGKGGVGKSTIAVNLAVALSEQGYKVGLMDIDFHGPNTLKMLHLEKQKLQSDGESLIPLNYSKNLKVVSMAALLETSDTAVIWRGPLKIGAIKQFIADVRWEKLDWLIIDSPPGTGDEPLSIAQIINNSKSIIVTTPQDISILDIRKSVNFCKQLKIKIIGIIENMSSFFCPHCGKKIEIFKSGGGKKTAKQMNLKYLGALPLDEKIMEASDKGIPYLSQFNQSDAGKAFEKIIKKILFKNSRR